MKKQIEEVERKKKEERVEEENSTTTENVKQESNDNVTTVTPPKKKKKKQPTPSTTENEEEEDESCGFSDLERWINIRGENGIENPVRIHGGFLKYMKPHQMEGVRFCWDLISKNKGCVLAHSMGLGKTLQMVAFTYLYIKYGLGRKILVLCPKNVMINWKLEFDKWLTLCANTSVPLQYIDDSDKTNERRLEMLNTWNSEGGVLIISFTLFHRLMGQYGKSKKIEHIVLQSHELNKIRAQRQHMISMGQSVDGINSQIKDLHNNVTKQRKNFIEKEEFETAARGLLSACDLVIVDEAHKISSTSDTYFNKALTMIETPHRLALTGTPMQNNLMAYYAMINWIKPDHWTREEFYSFFSKPIQAGMTKDAGSTSIFLPNPYLIYKYVNATI